MEATIQELDFLNHEKFHAKWKEKKDRKKNYCVLVYDVYDEVMALTPAELGRLMMAHMYYSVTGETPALQGNERFLFPRFKTLEDQFQNYFEEEGKKRSAKAKKASDAAREKRLAKAKSLDISQDTLRSREEPRDIHNYNTNSNPNTNSNTNTNPNTNSNANSNLSQGTAPAGCGACTDGEDGDERDLRERKEEIELSQEDKIMKDDPSDQEDPALERAVAAMEACCGITMTKGRREELAAFLRTLGEGSIHNAIERAESYGSRNWGYISRILRNWQENPTSARDRSVKRETESYGQGRTGGAYGADPQMYQRHGQTTLSELEREAIRSALEEE